MTVVVATRMVPGRLRDLPAFLGAAFRAAEQARRSPGFRAGRMRVELGLTFWTLTVWEDGRQMAAYRDSGFHARTAPRISRWAAEAAFALWQAPDDTLPRWAEVRRRLADRATYAPLERPSAQHLRHSVPPSARAGVQYPLRRRRS